MKDVFVFGSNLAGRHGKGAALYARQNHGAIYGIGEGLQGDSYAIPTKDRDLRPRQLVEIAASIERFNDFAESNPERKFQVTPVGCGYAGFQRSEIRPLFRSTLQNLIFTKEWDDTEQSI